MKRMVTFLIVVFPLMISLQANDYVMLSPLDTVALPTIPTRETVWYSLSQTMTVTAALPTVLT